MNFFVNKSLKTKLLNAPDFSRNLYIGLSLFSVYFCAYGFRKAFAAAEFSEPVVLPFIGEADYKLFLIIFQVLGYMTAKFVGIRLIAEARKEAGYLAAAIGLLLGAATLSWLFFALVPPPYSLIFIYLNGFPLGLIWGLVVSFSEGRRHTEILGTMLSAGFIFAAGVSLDIGKAVLYAGISAEWMPVVVSLMYILPLSLGLRLLLHIPPPSLEDVAARSERKPMPAAERRAFLKDFAPGIFAITAAYMLFNAFREYRVNFSSEIWDYIGFDKNSPVFSLSELAITVLILILLSLFYRYKNNAKAFRAISLAAAGGALVVGLSSILFMAGLIPGWLWMVLTGFGSYIGYIPFGSFAFDRLFALLNKAGTVGFLIYFIDSFAYLATIAVMLIKNFFLGDFDKILFMQYFGIVLAVADVILLLIAIRFFGKKAATEG